MNVQQGNPSGESLSDAGGQTGEVPPAALTADLPAGPDHLGRTAAAAFLAEVVLHRTAGSPFCIGVFGPAGAGKSRFMSGLLSAVEALSSAAEAAGLATPFLGEAVVARVEAEPGVSPSVSLVRQIRAVLSVSHPRLVEVAGQAGRDPHGAAHDTAERVNEVRHRLDTERRALDALTARQASLVDSLLFDTAGSQVDAYARGRRSRLERSFRGFGLSGDALVSFKEAVREASEVGEGPAQWLGGLRAFWAYRGQARLLMWAVVLLLLAWGVGALIAHQTALIDAVRGSGDKLGGVADGLQARWPWLVPIKRVLELGALAAVATNVVRGIRFLLPIRKGALLLRGELDSRRRDLDGLLAHQTSRVAALAREADVAGRHAADAEARLLPSATPPAGRHFGDHDGDPARSFLAAVSAGIRVAAKDRVSSGASAAPSRIVVGIDGLDDLPAEEAAAYLQTARRLLNSPGFVTIVAADRTHLAAGLAEADPALASARLTRLIQIPYRLRWDDDPSEAKAYARALLGPPTPDGSPADDTDASLSVLDRPWAERERAVVEAMAPVAGDTPRAVKRLVNLYSVARADPDLGQATDKDLAVLAVGLALQCGGSPFDGMVPSGSTEISDEVRQARQAASAALGGAPLGPRDGARGAAVARRYSLRD